MRLARFTPCCTLILPPGGACMAQGWPFWGSDFNRPFGDYEPVPRREGIKKSPRRDKDRKARSPNPVHDGGPRPVIAPKAPPIVAFPYSFPVNSIVIATGRRKLYFVLPEGGAYEYCVAIGREGFRWTGTEAVSHKQAWPDWYPPTENARTRCELAQENDRWRTQSARCDRPLPWGYPVSHPRYELRVGPHHWGWITAVADIFISYSKPDRDKVLMLAAYLESGVASLWWDTAYRTS